MKKAILSITFMACIIIAFAGSEKTKSKTPAESPVEMVKLSGTVVDINSDEVLAGVEVSIEGTDLKTYTDFDGNFEFDQVKPGKYNVIASFISYQKSLVENYSAKAKQSEKMTIKLQASN